MKLFIDELGWILISVGVLLVMYFGWVIIEFSLIDHLGIGTVSNFIILFVLTISVMITSTMFFNSMMDKFAKYLAGI